MKHRKRKARGNKRLRIAFISDYSRLCLLIPLTYWVNFKSWKLFTLNKNISIYAQKFYLLQIWYYFIDYIYVILWIWFRDVALLMKTKAEKSARKYKNFYSITLKLLRIKTVKSSACSQGKLTWQKNFYILLIPRTETSQTK